MYAPILEIDTRKIEENARKLHTFCALRGVEQMCIRDSPL